MKLINLLINVVVVLLLVYVVFNVNGFSDVKNFVLKFKAQYMNQYCFDGFVYYPYYNSTSGKNIWIQKIVDGYPVKCFKQEENKEETK